MLRLRRRTLALSSFLLFAVVSGQLLFDGALSSAEAKKSKGESTAEPAEENFKEGVVRYKNHDFDGAVDSFLQSTYYARNGYYPEGYFWLGKSYMAKHDDIKAIEAFKKHVSQNMKKTPQAHIYLAEIYLRNNRDAEANQSAKDALSDAEGPCPEGHLILAKLLVKQGGYMSAESQFMTALGDHPWKFTEAWMCYAECKMKAKDWIAAYDLFEKMLEAKGRLENLDLPKVYLDMGVCRLARGDHQGAIDQFHQCLEVDPGCAAAHMELALLFEQETHYSSAIKEYTLYCSTADQDDKRVPLAKNRILKLEQKISADTPAPVVQPSPYMVQQQQLQQQQMQQKQAPKDSGF